MSRLVFRAFFAGGVAAAVLSACVVRAICVRDSRFLIERDHVADGQWRRIPAVTGSPVPMRNDPAHPYVSNAIAARTEGQPNYRIGDLSNPNLKQWAKDVMKKDNDEVLAGKIAYTPGTSCRPAGTPALMLAGGPFYFVQTPKEVTIILEGDHQVRHVYLDVPHSANLKPSWYGESVGHYEGDTLVIDTIGQTTKTFVDNFRTPHTEKLHVVERWKTIDDGKQIQVHITVDDPETFNQPWEGTSCFRKDKGRCWRKPAPRTTRSSNTTFRSRTSRISEPVKRPEERERTMYNIASTTRFLAGVAAILGTAAFAAVAVAQVPASPPDFSSNGVGWRTANGTDYIAVPGQPKLNSQDPSYPYVGNGEAIRSGKQPTYRIADLTQSQPKQWAKDIMKKDNDEVKARQDRLYGRSVLQALRRSRGDALRWPILLRADAEGSPPDRGRRPAAAAHLYERVALGQSETVLVRRIGRPLRRRHAGHRHHRDEQQDLRRQLPHAAHREAARRRALAADRRRQDDRSPS